MEIELRKPLIPFVPAAKLDKKLLILYFSWLILDIAEFCNLGCWVSWIG